MKKMMMGALLALCATVAQAEPASNDSVRQLLEVSGARAMLDGLGPLIEQSMQGAMADMASKEKLNARQQALMDAWPAKFAKLMGQELSWAHVEQDYIRIYQESFSQEEVDGMIAFYQSPVGQATVRKLPVVLQKSMAFSQSQMQNMMPKLKALIAEHERELKAAR